MLFDHPGIEIILLISFCIFGNTVFGGGHTQNNAFGFVLVVPSEEVQRVDSVLVAHREFMEKTHSVTGNKSTRLNAYSVIKAPEMVQFSDPSKGMTGNILYILSEHYETPTGLGRHLEEGSKWSGIEEMQEIMYKYATAVVMGKEFSSMNR